MRILTSLMLLAVIGCMRPAVESQEKKFCIPQRYALSERWALWSQGSAPKVGAYAFRGCEVTSVDCDFPPEILGGVIELELRLDRSWSGIPEDAFYKQVLTNGNPIIEPLRSDSYVIVRNPEITWQSFIWKLSSKPKLKEIEIGDGDRLVATCSAPSASRAKFGYEIVGRCERFLQERNYGVFYRFVFDERKPENFKELDKKLESVIASWRCHK